LEVISPIVEIALFKEGNPVYPCQTIHTLHLGGNPMSLNQLHTAITAKVWKAIAQSQIDISGLAREDVDKLVDLVVDAALEEVDGQLEQVSIPAEAPSVDLDAGDEDDEEVLWTGRPFMSLTVTYMITSERVRISEGLLGKERTDVELVRIQSMDHKQSLTDRAINVGDIYIISHDPQHPEFTLENIKDPQGVHEILRRAVLKAREKYRLSYREEM
jgi:hypothetical protein